MDMAAVYFETVQVFPLTVALMRLLWLQWPLVLLLLKMMMMAALLWRNKTWKKEVVSDGSSFNWRKFGT
jgi:cytochrome c-type biogenesis protein CcmH/NrfF